MKRLSILLAAGSAVLAVAASPAAAATQGYSVADKQWLQAAMQGDRFEIQGGGAAQGKGEAQQVKDLGARLRADHAKALRRAEKVAKSLGIGRPSKPTTTQLWELQTTVQFSGNDFDRHYASLEVADHHQDIQEGKDEAEDGFNRRIRALARQDLKMYRMHLKLSQNTLGAVGG